MSIALIIIIIIIFFITLEHWNHLGCNNRVVKTCYHDSRVNARVQSDLTRRDLTLKLISLIPSKSTLS